MLNKAYQNKYGKTRKEFIQLLVKASKDTANYDKYEKNYRIPRKVLQSQSENKIR